MPTIYTTHRTNSGSQVKYNEGQYNDRTKWGGMIYLPSTGWTGRATPGYIFLMTQVFDYLCTQDDKPIVLQSSKGEWIGRTTI